MRSNKPMSFAPAMNGESRGGKVKLTEKEEKRFQALVRKAKTLAEIQKLEKAQSEGRLPAGVMDDEMDET